MRENGRQWKATELMVPILTSMAVVLGLVGAASALLLKSGERGCSCCRCRRAEPEREGK